MFVGVAEKSLTNARERHTLMVSSVAMIVRGTGYTMEILALTAEVISANANAEMMMGDNNRRLTGLSPR